MTQPSPPPDNVLILKPDGTIAFASRPLAGVPPDDVAGTSFYGYLASDQRDVVEDCLSRVFAGGETSECELAGLRPAATDAWFECRFSLNRGAKSPAASVVIRDVTMRHEREEALRRELEALKTGEGRSATPVPPAPNVPESPALPADNGDTDPLARFLSSVQESGEAIFVTDAETGRIVDANTTACRWLRMRRRDVLGTTERDLTLEFPLTAPPETDPALTDTRTAQRPLLVNHGQHRRRDRSTFPVEVSLTHHRIDGRLYVLAVAREIKDREHTREQLGDLERVYGTLFELCQDAVILTARDGRIENINAAAAKLLGYDRETVVAQQLQQLYRDPSDIRRFRAAVHEHGEVRELDVELRRADGSTLAARLSAVPRRGIEGEIRGYQCVVQKSGNAAPVLRRVLAPTRVAVGRSAGPRPAPPLSEVPSDGAAHGPSTVLLLAPEDRFRADLRAALQTARMRVVEAPTVGEGLRVVRDPQQPIDVALVDATWAAVDEWALLEAVQQHRPGVPVLLTQADSEHRDAAAGSENVRGTLAMPAHPLTLVQRVRNVLKGS
jgi:PAS domain S-box-containing protein